MSRFYNGRPGLPPADFVLQCDQVPGQRRRPWLSRAQGVGGGSQPVVRWSNSEMADMGVRVEYGKTANASDPPQNVFCSEHCVPSPMLTSGLRMETHCKSMADGTACDAVYTHHTDHKKKFLIPCDCSEAWAPGSDVTTGGESSLFGQYLTDVIGSNATEGTGFTTPALASAKQELSSLPTQQAMAAMYIEARQALTKGPAPEYLTAEIEAFAPTSAKGDAKQQNEARLYLLSYKLNSLPGETLMGLPNFPVASLAPYVPYVFDPTAPVANPRAIRATGTYQISNLASLLYEWKLLLTQDIDNAVAIANEYFELGQSTASPQTKQLISNFASTKSPFQGCPVGMYQSKASDQNCFLSSNGAIASENVATEVGAILAAIMVHSQYVLNSQKNPSLFPQTFPSDPVNSGQVVLGGVNAPPDPVTNFNTLPDVMPDLDVPLNSIAPYKLTGGQPAPPEPPCVPTATQKCKPKDNTDWEDIIIGVGVTGMFASLAYLYYVR